MNPLIPGDGGYALLRWLLRPYNFTPALTVAEQRFLIILKMMCGKSIWVIKRHVNNCLAHPENDRLRSVIRDVVKYFIRA